MMVGYLVGEMKWRDKRVGVDVKFSLLEAVSMNYLLWIRYMVYGQVLQGGGLMINHDKQSLPGQ